MRFRIVIISIPLLLYSSLLVSQVLSYVQYDTKTGLAGSSVYEMCQDQNGFLWAATDNGLSRFDGKNFRNYTVDDGLPDNEVLKILADSKGRVWIGSFSKELSYYFNGKIRNKSNDSFLANPLFEIQALFFVEDREGNVLITDYRKAVLITTNNEVVDFTNLPEIKKHKFTAFAANYYFFDKGFFVRLDDSTFQYKDSKLIFYEYDKPRAGYNKYFPRYFKSRQDTAYDRVEIEVPADIISTTNINGTPLFQSTIDGAWSVDTIRKKLDQHFLPGKKVSRTLVDREQNIWFATLGDGIFKLPSKEMLTLRFVNPQNKSNTEVYTICPFESGVIAGIGSSKFAQVQQLKLNRIVDFADRTKQSANSLSTNRLYCSFSYTGGAAFLGYDAFLVRLENNRPLFKDIIAVKSINKIDNDNLVVGTFAFAFKVKQSDLTIVDTIWRGRCTEAYFDKGAYYIGAMNGLYKIDANKKQTFLGDIHPAFKRKISDIQADESGNLFVATVDMGMILLNEGKVTYWFKDANGLSSNICKSVFIDKHHIWVGTSNGVNKISRTNFKNVVKYGSSDGLPSDNINDVYKQDNYVWVGSPEGLTFFDESKVSGTSLCNLVIEVSTEGQLTSTDHYDVSYKSPQISFDFFGISFRSGGEMLYNYRLLGLDTNWLHTRQNTRKFTALPAGDYVFELYAVNKFGINSDLKKIYFSIDRPFWKAWWFYFLILLATALITAWIVNRNNRKIRKQMYEANRFQKQFAELEQQALQAQMNPNFIFNSLNSIQQYILADDKRMANQFLTGFAAIIRQTLDISGKSNITIAEEIHYLSIFLDVEKMKYTKRISYSIKTDHGMQSDFYEIPPMMLQPFAENAIVQAFKYDTQWKLHLNINFKLEADMIVCTLQDNVPFKNQSESYDMVEQGDRTARGILLAKRRIDLLNEHNIAKIDFQIEELTEGSGSIAGTKVTIKIPIS